MLADLRACAGRSLGGQDGIEETQLLTHKADVSRVNEEVWAIEHFLGDVLVGVGVRV